MTTRDDVIGAIRQIEKAGYAGEATRAARLELLVLPSQDCDRILKRLQVAFPQLFPSGGRVPVQPAPTAATEQRGVAAQAMRRAEAALAQQQSAVADFDRQVIEALLNAHKTTTGGRALLDDLEARIDCAARTWDLGTTAGAREFQRFLISRLDQVIKVVEEANDDDESKRALAAAWAALYAAQAGPDESTGTGRDDPPSMGSGPAQDASDVAGEPYPDMFAPEEVGSTGVDAPRRTVPAGSMIPAVPGFGGAGPSSGVAPAGAIPAGLLPAGLQRASSPPQLDGRPPEPADDLMVAADAPVDAPGGPDSDPADGPSSTDPTTARLPDGETVTAATPRIAAVIQAAADGMPVAEAFRQQGITIPPPGSPVSGQVDQSHVGPGDIGMFTDRHALAVGNGKALLDGQIQQINNVGGPSFLGWQHPPAVGEMEAPAPTPTRLSATLRA